MKIKLESSLLQNFREIYSEDLDDDAIEIDGKVYCSDLLTDKNHFDLDYWKPEEIGKKAIESNVSDLAVSGAIPKYFLVNLVISKDFSSENVSRLAQGIQSAASKYDSKVIGGDTTSGKALTVSIFAIGVMRNGIKFIKRGGVKDGDYLCVTGDLGASTMALKYLQSGNPRSELYKKFPYLAKRHFFPLARLKESKIISKYANSAVDVSDGLGSEANYLAENSKLGLQILEEKIPINNEVLKCNEFLASSFKNKDLISECVFSGGEDFEILFSVSQENLAKLEKEFRGFSIIGNFDKDKEVTLKKKNGEVVKLEGGYDHFKN